MGDNGIEMERNELVFIKRNKQLINLQRKNKIM